MTVESQYVCRNCGFFIEFEEPQKSRPCFNCPETARATGRVRRMEGDDIVEYRRGVPVSRWQRAGIEKPKPEVLT